jgi:hypothetical protein
LNWASITVAITVNVLPKPSSACTLVRMNGSSSRASSGLMCSRSICCGSGFSTRGRLLPPPLLLAEACEFADGSDGFGAGASSMVSLPRSNHAATAASALYDFIRSASSSGWSESASISRDSLHWTSISANDSFDMRLV